MRVFVLCLTLLFPMVSQAAVSISEVAWMGTEASANHEWIELHNDGSAVSVDGWVLTDDMNLSIELLGTIPAGSYVVLERTSDASAPGEAFMIYTGSLVNTGATLRLLRADGAVADQISGGEDWVNIGGDNVTKETAQYTSAGWVTAVPTPGRDILLTEIEIPVAEESATDSDDQEESSGTRAVPLEVPNVSLALTVSAPTVAYVNQSVPFSVTATGIGQRLIDSLQYQWNFGDGIGSSAQKETEYTFQYPGTYVVTIYASYKRQEQVARHEITILPVTLSVTMNDTGDVQINNDSPYELDLSEYRVTGERTVTFPPRTILLPNQTITIPQHRLGETNERMLVVYDIEETAVAMRLPSQDVAVATEDIVVTVPAAPAPQTSAMSTSFPTSLQSGSFGFTELDEQAPLVKVEEREVDTAAGSLVPSSSQLAAVSAAGTTGSWTYLGLAGVLLVGIIGVLAAPRRNELE